ncbi:DUF692 family multinuclear iron-containing protein [Chryseobacterium sp. Leaf394]|uniref:MNIO family chryseobactin maturase n=1 Tax=Chryseobacterium sp. Leaf394 TaxID=1736361 RepID=UPI0006FE30C9|nr:DUF692 family multinuclear iron-containing protein [Chryseobacterium sp. Leaf394]KQS91330.1 hypothetical protein ASG21_02270 [Chryseobacterium sp. Leaf394]
MNNKPLLGTAMMAETEFVSAVLPLLENNEIDILEWSFDTFYHADEPKWLSGLLDFYSENNRLIGHGVYYSLFDAKWTDRQEHWIEKLKSETKKRNYNHITEHFGFMNTENFHQGIPLPVPLHSKILQLGKDRLLRLQDALEIPIGIENLAFSFSADDVKEQGEFLEKLIEDIDGFLILDLHNLYCQAVNFNIDILELVAMYPLEKVREIHLSGGSWENSSYTEEKRIRRDTHDDSIPREILEVLPKVLSVCHQLEYIIIERLGHTLTEKSDTTNFLNDFKKVRQIVNASEVNSFLKKNWKKKNQITGKPLEDLLLYEDQTKLTKLLFDSVNPEIIKNYHFNYFEIEKWDLEMIDTASKIIKKWNPY